jgi:SAM-dependent methyltransferase
MECRICGNSRDNKSYEVLEMMFGYRDRFNYFQCSNCDCLQIADIPSDMSKYYPSDYHSFAPIKETSNPLITIIKNFIINLRNNYAIYNRGIIGKLIYRKFPNQDLHNFIDLHLTKKSGILDVGCGSGRLLYNFAITGFNNLLGIDPYIEKDIVYSNTLKILKKNIYKIDGKWDLIMFHHSFEHISDPIETIEKVSTLLVEGGICLLRIPTVSSFAWEHYRENWVQLDAPRHFFLHSVKSIKIIAERTNLELERIVYDSSSFQFRGSEQYIKGIPLIAPRSKSIFSEDDLRRFAADARKLNLENRGDQAAFYLRKK